MSQKLAGNILKW